MTTQTGRNKHGKTLLVFVVDIKLSLTLKFLQNPHHPVCGGQWVIRSCFGRKTEGIQLFIPTCTGRKQLSVQWLYGWRQYASNFLDVSIHTSPPIVTPTIVERDLFFGQGKDQLNGGRGGTVDFQPVLIRTHLPSSPTIVMHRRLGTDQCDGGTIACSHSTQSTITHFHVGTSSDAASTLRPHTIITTLFHKDIFHRKRGISTHSNIPRLTECQVLQMTIPLNTSIEPNPTHDLNLTFINFRITHNVHGGSNLQRIFLVDLVHTFPHHNSGQTIRAVHPFYRFLQRVAISRHTYFCFWHPFENRFDLTDVSSLCRTPISLQTVVEGDLFFRQGGDQLNGGRMRKQTIGNFQPVITTVSSCTIVMHLRLGPDQCDGATDGCKHSILSTFTHFHVGTFADASTIRIHTIIFTLFHKDIFHRKRGKSRHSIMI